MIRIGHTSLVAAAAALLTLLPGASQAQEESPIRTVQTLRISDLKALPLLNGKPTAEFTVENETFDIFVELENRFEARHGNLKARLECDHPVDLIRKFAKDKRSVSAQEFTLYEFRNAGKISIRLPRLKIVCDLYLKERESDVYDAGVRILSESPFSRLNAPECAARANEPSMLGCETAAESIELLSDPIASFNKKIEALTGTPLPLEVIASQNVDYPIDFSRAPKLDALVVATMEFKIDFYGTTLAKILKWHADQGTKVRIVVPGVPAMFFPADADFLRDLETSNRNIQVQLYKDTSRNSGRLDRMHRVTHAKMVVGISSEEPHRSFSVLGGRNVKDTFLFRSAPDYSKRPEMEQYGKLTSPFGFFDDLEVLVHGQETAKSITRDFISFWNRDKDTLRMRPAAQVGKEDRHITAGKGPRVRHVLSIPFADGYQMEQLVVSMIGSARNNIRMVSPYFRPTPSIGAAIRDAAERGVSIQFVTELDLMKDNAPPITMGVNTQSVNRYRKLINISISRDKHAIIHSKAILVDDEHLFVSGTNLNMRSFIHDVENGLFIEDAQAAAQFRTLFDTVYLRQSTPVSDELKVKFMDQLFIPLVDQYF